VTRTFLLFIVALSIVAAGAVWIIEQGWFAQPVHYSIITLYLFFITAALGYKLMRLQHTRPEKFVTFFLASMAIKLLGHITFLLALALANRATLFADAVYFICLYGVFTAISMAALYKGRNP
jgi:hypothetical protein